MADSVLPKGSTILVTGATGSVGGPVALEILKAGYKVRAAVRNQSKGGILIEALTAKGFGDAVETVVVTDMTAPGALDSALQGCVGIAHVASDVTFGPNPHEVITPTVSMARNILESAAKTPSIKRFVYTSSTATLPQLESGVHLTPSSWTDPAVVDMAWAEPHSQEKAPLVYTASKYLGEKACWDFMAERKPHFDLNTVVPNANFGAVLDPRLLGSINGLVYAAANGDPTTQAMMNIFPPMYMINFKDDALLHLAGLTLPDVKGERLLGMGEPYTYDLLIDAVHKVKPDAKLPPKQGLPLPAATVDRSRSEEVTARLGKPKWTGLDESIKQMFESVEGADLPDQLRRLISLFA